MTSGQLLANLVDIAAKRIFKAAIVWSDGVITEIRELAGVDSSCPYLLPGFIDAHVHIESSMLTPAEFARIAVRHGTVATVSDPHEIANVLGMAGIDYMLASARHTPFKFFFGAPACVPATAFETAGARLDAAQLESLFKTGKIRYLSEVMNYPAVLAHDPAMLKKLALAQRYGYPIDGHAPGLSGDQARAYAAAGISTDHECAALAEAEAKLASGMQIQIREGSAARNFDTLHPLISRYPEQLMFCSDDKHPDDLLAGHINSLVVRAIAHGHRLFDVLQCACLNPIKHYGLPVGQLRLGDSMDAVLVDDLQQFRVGKTWIAGQLVASNGNSLLPHWQSPHLNQFHARKIQPDDLAVPASAALCRVIKVTDGELITQQLLQPARFEQGRLVADLENDILWLVVVNRYQPAPPAVALVQGFGLHDGALASTVAHDSHNIIAVGCDPAALCQAVNGIIDQQGGIGCVHNGQFECLPLPVAGLISDADGDSVGQRYQILNQIARQQMGSALRAPFMTLSFMALLVIPQLKLSDKGLFDSQQFVFTSLGC